jgi:hypothetical protein
MPMTGTNLLPLFLPFRNDCQHIYFFMCEFLAKDQKLSQLLLLLALFNFGYCSGSVLLYLVAFNYVSHSDYYTS